MYPNPCLDCGKERWVPLRHGQPRWLRCKQCENKRKIAFGEKAPFWKGGRIVVTGGYIKIKIYPDNFFYLMADKEGYVMEHRLVVAKALGRCLHRWEIIHHINHIKDDNRFENLQLVTDDRHKQISILERRITYLEQRVTLLEAENVLLREVNYANDLATD